MTRNGKIARLPRSVRNQLNQRLHDGAPGIRVLKWLNALPEVQAGLAAEFEGRPVNAQNLSDWKLGGYQDWVAQQDALELAQHLGEDAVELQPAGCPTLTDTVALWLAARYAVATRQVNATEGAEGWRLLRELCADIVELRRGDHSAERLRLERERVELQRKDGAERTDAALLEWARQPENQMRICAGQLTDEEREDRIREIYGLPPRRAGDGADGAALIKPNQGGSSPIKPDELATQS